MARQGTISVGPFTALVSIDTAISTASDPKTVCIGRPGAEHPPTARTAQPYLCEHCGVVDSTCQTKKALKIGGEWSIIDESDLVEIKADIRKPFLEKPEFSPSPREAVEALVGGAHKMYYLTPSAAPNTYANIRAMVASRQDLAFMGLFAPTSASQPTLFELAVRGDLLVLIERRLVTGLKPAPAVVAEGDKWEAMAVAAVDGLVVDFDESTYDLHYAERVAEAFARGERVAIDGTSKAKAAAPVDDTELGAELARLVAVAKKAPTAKSVAAKKAVAAKKTAAKKTAAKKTAARKVA